MRFNLNDNAPDEVLAYWRVSTRLDRAVPRVDYVEEVAPSVFQIPSSRTGELYTVDLENRSCTCKDYVFRSSVTGLPCKHWMTVYLAVHRKPEGD